MTAYVYDPDDPTPALGGPSLLPDSGPVDNAAHETRPDVAVFRGDPLPDLREEQPILVYKLAALLLDRQLMTNAHQHLLQMKRLRDVVRTAHLKGADLVFEQI